MLDDLESNIIKEEKSESTSNKFPLSRFSLPVSQQNVNILSMSTSKRFIYLVTDRSELLRIESESLKLLHKIILEGFDSVKELIKTNIMETSEDKLTEELTAIDPLTNYLNYLINTLFTFSNYYKKLFFFS